MSRRLPLASAPIGARRIAPLYLAAALCITGAIALTAIAVWHLDDGERGERLAAVPWSCCVLAR